MKRFRQLDGIGGWARNFALFALLLQFTLPMGIAISADLPGVPFNSAAIFDCLGGDTDNPETSNRGWHGCALPGGCCVPSGSAGLAVSSAEGHGTVIATVSAIAGAATVPARPPAQNLVRGPPDTSA